MPVELRRDHGLLDLEGGLGDVHRDDWTAAVQHPDARADHHHAGDLGRR